MNAAKMVMLAGISGALASVSTLAVPLDITLIGGTPTHEWGINAYNDPGFQDYVTVANGAQAGSINLAGVNSITMTWAAPAGYMYVINPPPAGVLNNSESLLMEEDYGFPGQSSSLGHVTASSFSINTVYGTSPLSASVEAGPVLIFAASGDLSSGSEPFAFTSMSISAAFSGTGADVTLDKGNLSAQTGFFVFLNGDFAMNGIGTFSFPPDPGPLITLEPLPSGSAPDVSSTLTLAGIGFFGLLLVGRKQKQLPVNC